ncbi:NAD(+) kinase [Methylotenera sp.]|uniref:NAD(+) kinase n=1 Tax=Methylotenera sp. TaxID=2051956 RepID=UPI002727EC18|nr:NAD(+) kinase [Methylotenera sp.]MDO9205230.1 NAD(+) kinase [Methylotenera sp.]MDP2070965.1 NAD(+) kinase [Methylotenera sp.]MDP3005839.1 NAD(+) kinase [Methylotenera sp.]
MQTSFKSIAIIGKYMNQSALQLMQRDLADLASHLSAKHIEVWIEENTAQHAELSGFKTASLESIGSKVDLVIVMGGDGTMLSVARSLIDDDVPLVGVNRGRFGFLTDLRVEDMLVQIDRILAGDFIKEPRVMLAAKVVRDNQVLHANYALNDVVIKSALRLIELEVTINEKFVHKQRADGLIISTPTGTTAYALSAGGPILHPNLHAFTLVPICPHTLSNRPIAVHSDSQIEVTVVQFDEAQLSFDGQFQVTLEIGDKIIVTRAQQTISLLHPSDYCYFDMLRNKLNWG